MLGRRKPNVRCDGRGDEAGDSDENEVEEFDYGEPHSFGYDSKTSHVQPVQIRSPTVSKIPADRLHVAVWRNDAYKVQTLVLEKGKTFC